MGLFKKLAVAGIAAAVLAKVGSKREPSPEKKPIATTAKAASKPRRRKSRAKASTASDVRS